MMPRAAACASLVLLLLVLGGGGPATALPPFSWDIVPTYIHCANISGPWNDKALERMTSKGVGFVVFEKVHGLLAAPINTSAETKIAAACAQVKAAATAGGTRPPDCYQYVEVDWARTWYTLGHEVSADPDALAMHYDNSSRELLTTRENVGWNKGDAPPVDGALDLHYEFDAYDFRSAEMQAKWVARITDAVATGHVDGAFIDGNRGGWGFGGISACEGNKSCAAAMSAGLAAAHLTAATAIGRNKTLISNYPTPEAMAVCNGGMCERCGSDVKTVLELQKNYAHRKCGLFNDSCVLEYRPFGTGHHFPPYTSLGNRSIAAFLLAAGPHAYYGANSETGIGPDACFGDGGSMTISTWPDMQRPLGVPQGDFKNSTVKASWALTRVFGAGNALTKVAMSSEWSCIWWSDGFITSFGQCPPTDQLGPLFADWAPTARTDKD